MSSVDRSTARDVEEYALPSVEALLAGTLALMTGVAQAAPGCTRVGPMARKIVANLDELMADPGLTDTMHRFLARLRANWHGLACAHLPAAAAAPPDRTLWLHSPALLQ